MKKFLVMLSIVGLGLTSAMAQQTQTQAKPAAPAKQTSAPATKEAKHDEMKKEDKKEEHVMKKDGTPDMRHSNNKHMKKDGTPDMRHKENKEKKEMKEAKPATK